MAAQHPAAGNIRTDNAGRCIRIGAVRRDDDPRAADTAATAIVSVSAATLGNHYLRRCVLSRGHVGRCVVELTNGRMVPIALGVERR